MKAVLLRIVVVLLLLAGCLWAQPSPADPSKNEKAKTISATDADKHLQENAVVTGKVVQVTVREKLVYVNLEKRFPNTPLAGVIFARSTNQFGDLKGLEGKQVELRGKIEEYRGKPQIVLNTTNQLKVLETSGAKVGSDSK